MSIRKRHLTDVTLDRISLTVRDAGSMVAFFTARLGMIHLSGKGSRHELGFTHERAVLELVEDDLARIRPAGAPGLFHVAYLYPTRSDLAGALHRLASSGWPLQGAADHGVSEAIYLSDPEGNGIELYADRPKEEWPFRNGSLEMYTEALDLDELLSKRTDGRTIAPARIGHIHLQVSSLTEANAFWCGRIGLEATQSSFPGALFASAGGYHHHLGLNVWRSGGQTLPDGAWTGLRSMDMTVPDAGEFSELCSRFNIDQEEERDMLTPVFETTTINIRAQMTSYT